MCWAKICNDCSNKVIICDNFVRVCQYQNTSISRPDCSTNTIDTLTSVTNLTESEIITPDVLNAIKASLDIEFNDDDRRKNPTVPTPCLSHSCLGHVPSCPYNGYVFYDEYTPPEEQNPNTFAVQFYLTKQPELNPLTDAINGEIINGGSLTDPIDYWTAMADQLNKQYRIGGGETEENFAAYNIYGDTVYDNSHIITLEHIQSLYATVDRLMTDCVCNANTCGCYIVCQSYNIRNCTCNKY